MVATFDTLKAARRLQDEAGFDEKQAAVLVSTFAEGVGENLATKTDLAALRSDVKDAAAQIRAEMREMVQRVYVRVGAMVAGASVFLTAVIGIATAILLANL
jgi:hypothetical protein